MMLRYIFYAFLIFLAYRLIVGFIIPVYKTTKQVKRQFRDIQERMQEQQFAGQQQSTRPESSPPKKSADGPRVGDYIDFEEVKQK